MNINSKESWHALGTDEVLSRLESSKDGLKQTQAVERLIKYGSNELSGDKEASPWGLLAEQFKNVLIIILLIAVAISAFMGEVIDAIIIFIIIMFAVGLGFIQEYRASKSIQALKRMAAPQASVLRDEKEVEIPARELVPGDIIVIRMGDVIPADSRIIEEFSLRANEAALTGESTAVDKVVDAMEQNASVADRLNMLYAGTNAVYGRGKAVVVETGNTTEFGKIAKMLKEVKQEKTPLQINLDNVGKWIAIAAIALSVVLAGMGIIRGHEPLEMLIWGVSLAVAAVPEALPAVVTISLALGVGRMVKRHALIRKLSAVETLGCTTVICSDKTGTLTQDQMTLKKIHLNGQFVTITGTGYEPKGEFFIDDKQVDRNNAAELHKYLIMANLCSDTKLYQGESGHWTVKGDPTEGAFLVAAHKAGLPIEQIYSSYTQVGEIPFTSETKRMISVYREADGDVAYSNGAAEVILMTCDYVYLGGQEKKLDQEGRAKINGVIQQMAGEGLRVLGTAYRRLQDKYTLDDSIARGMVLMGLAGMIDPPRPEAKDSIKVCDKAGIKTVMITGDHKLTAVAIAEQLGIRKAGMALTGDEINRMSQEEFEKVVDKVDIYARVSPDHKLRVVDALAKKEHVVAMTGDGVNDAPALKKADIGIAMGIKGTDVTKEAADMILTDDNFASIVAAVDEGRGIYDNIKKYLMYLLSSNIGEILLMAVAILFGPLIGLPNGAIPLIAIQILWVNLATDGFPAIALAVDPPAPDLMDQKPRPRGQGIFTKPVLVLMAVGGLWSCFVNIGIFKWALDSGRGTEQAQALCFLTLILIQFFKAYNFRSDKHSVFKIGLLKNKWLNLAILWETVLLLLITYTPFLQEPFHTFNLGAIDWIIVILVAMTVFPVLEVTKLIIRLHENRNNE